MTEKEFDASACIIGEQMNKFSGEKACNFGFITLDNNTYRIFVGGDISNIANGIVNGLLNICAQTGVGEEFIEAIATSAILHLNQQKGIPVQ